MYKVKLSVNAPLKNSSILRRTGFSHIEPSNTDLMQMTSLDFEKAAEDMKENGLLCQVIDNPIPCSVSLSDPAWDIRKWMSYLKQSGIRAQALGAKYWCIGNGASRMLGDDPARVMNNFYEMVDVCAEVGGAYGLDMIVEPLGPSVTNYLLNLEETAAFVKEIGQKNVFTMVDYRWEYEQGRPIADLYRYAELIVHAHIDDPRTDYAGTKMRRPPASDDGVNYSPFLDFIKSDAFAGALSIEANTFDDYEGDLVKAMELYRANEIVSTIS